MALSSSRAVLPSGSIFRASIKTAAGFSGPPCRMLGSTRARNLCQLSSSGNRASHPIPRSLCPQYHPRRQQSRRWYAYKTVEEAKARHSSGPFSFRAGALFLLSGGGLIWYFRHEKARMDRQRIANQTKGIGKPKVGGPFDLLDQDGKPYSSENLHGRYSLVYFGFSHCPDICPDELDKMARIIDLTNEQMPGRATQGLLPLMITCDPARDSPAVLKQYLAEFHPAIIGLTGSWEQIKDVCKKYRVYFSTPADVKPGQDYLVDHSIYFYLMDPEGDFVEAIGRQHTPEAATKLIVDHVKDWKGPLS